jgi:hypothetical protein
MRILPADPALWLRPGQSDLPDDLTLNVPVECSNEGSTHKKAS